MPRLENQASPVEVKRQLSRFLFFQAAEASVAEPLSLRESEVLALLLAGKSVKEIAAALAIAPNTARAHLRGIHRKLDAHTRFEVYQRAKELNLVGR